MREGERGRGAEGGPGEAFWGEGVLAVGGAPDICGAIKSAQGQVG